MFPPFKGRQSKNLKLGAYIQTRPMRVISSLREGIIGLWNRSQLLRTSFAFILRPRLFCMIDQSVTIALISRTSPFSHAGIEIWSIAWNPNSPKAYEQLTLLMKQAFTTKSLISYGPMDTSHSSFSKAFSKCLVAWKTNHLKPNKISLKVHQSVHPIDHACLRTERQTQALVESMERDLLVTI